MSTRPAASNEIIGVQALWEKYEDIAMHFNDLLMKLRTHSLAVIAALSTAVGIFAKNGTGTFNLDWGAAEALFVAMALFWTAIATLDFGYYNRLLLAAVKAIKELEAECKPGANFTVGIRMSTCIEDEFDQGFWRTLPPRLNGVICFYLIVFAAIVAGIVYSNLMRS